MNFRTLSTLILLPAWACAPNAPRAAPAQSALTACGVNTAFMTTSPVDLDRITGTLSMGDFKPPYDLLPNGEGGFQLDQFHVPVVAPGAAAIEELEWTLFVVSPGRQGIVDYSLRLVFCEDDDGRRVHGEFAHVNSLAPSLAATLVDDWGTYLPSSADFAGVALDGALTDAKAAALIAQVVTVSGGAIEPSACEVYAGGDEIVLKCKTTFPGRYGLFPAHHLAVDAGAPLGTAGAEAEYAPTPWGLDFNLYDDRAEWPWIRADDRPMQVCPYEYFVETAESPLRSTLSALVGRDDGTCGTLDVDRPGTAAGIWIRRDHPQIASVIPLAEPAHEIAPYLLVLAPSDLHPTTRQVVATAIPGMVDVAEELPDGIVTTAEKLVNPPFESITVDSGKRCFTGSTYTGGLLHEYHYLLEVVSEAGADVLWIERVATACADLDIAAASFSDAAHALVR